MLAERTFGDAGARVVIEERLTGREVTMMALCDGTRLALLASSEDHKAVGDGDVGPNTGGMGTVLAVGAGRRRARAADARDAVRPDGARAGRRRAGRSAACSTAGSC